MNMTSSEDQEVLQLLRDVVNGCVPIENVAVVKNVSWGVSNETLTNFLEAISDNKLDVESVCVYEKARDVRLAKFKSKFKEDYIKDKLCVKFLSNIKIEVTVLESPQGIIVRNVPDSASEDAITFYLENVLRKESIEVNTKMYKEIKMAVIEVENPDRGLPVIFQTEPHKVCGDIIVVEPYVKAIHNDYIAALLQNQKQAVKTTQATMDESSLSPENFLHKTDDKAALYVKNVTIPVSHESEKETSPFPMPFEKFDGNPGIHDQEWPKTEELKTKPPSGGNLRIFFSNSDQQTSKEELHSIESDSGAKTDNSGFVAIYSRHDSGSINSSFESIDQSSLSLESSTHGMKSDTQFRDKTKLKPKKYVSLPRPNSHPVNQFQDFVIDRTSRDQTEKNDPDRSWGNLVPRGHTLADDFGQYRNMRSGKGDLKTDHINYSDKKEKVMLLKLSNFTNECANCNIEFDTYKGVVVISGTEDEVQIAKLKQYEILNSVEQVNSTISKNMADVLNKTQSKDLIKRKLDSKSVKACAVVTNDGLLQAHAFSKAEANKASQIIKGSLEKKEIPYNDSHFQFLNGKQWTLLVEELEKSHKFMMKIMVLRDQRLIVVEGWKKEVSQTVSDIQDVLKDNSDQSLSAQLFGGKAKCFNMFLQNKMQDVHDNARKNNVKLKVNNHGDKSVTIEVKGTIDVVKIVESQVQQLVNNIWQGKLDFRRISTDENDQALMSKALSSNKGTDLLRTFEQQHRCIIEVYEGQTQVSMSNFEFTPSTSSSDDGFALQKAYSMSDISDDGDRWTDVDVYSETESLSDAEDVFTPRERVRLSTTDLTSNTDITSQKTGNTTIKIKQGDITKEKAGVLVNVVPIPSMRVKDSAVYSAFVKAGGKELEKYFQARKDDADRNVVYTNSGGNLQCNYVFHLLLAKWQDGQKLQSALESCFEWCDSLGASSVSFPAVGVGKYLKYPPDIVAQLMISEARKAANRYNLQEISFVIYDQSIMPVYRRTLETAINPLGFPLALPPPSVSPRISEFRASPNSRWLSTDSSQAHGRGRASKDRPAQIMAAREKYVRPRHQRREHATERRHRPRTSFTPRHREPSPDDLPNPGKVQVKLVTVEVFAESTPHGEKVRSDLSKKIKAEFLALQEIKDKCIKHLSKDLKKKIFGIDACKHRRVILSVNAEKNSIVIKGEKEDVRSTTEILQILLESDNSMKKGTRHKPRHERGTKEYWRDISENPPSPSYWKHFDKGFSLFDPVRKLFNYPRVEYVDVDPKTFSAILNLINKTWQRDVVGQGKDAQGLSHRSLHVKKVKRIENFDLYSKYSIKRIEFFKNKYKHHGKVNKFVKLDQIKLAKSGPILTNQHIDGILTSDIWPEINEHYLFHGTTDKVVDNILKKGLDFRHSSEKGMFGKGTYAAESSTKADQYADDPSQRQPKNRKMLLVRMLLGNIYVATKTSKYSKPPCQCMKEDCTNPEHDDFDSVVGEVGKLFREFVVYQIEQCYPEYLITYDRV